MSILDYSLEIRLSAPALLTLSVGLGLAWAVLRRRRRPLPSTQVSSPLDENVLAGYRHVMHLLSHEFAGPVQTILTCLDNLTPILVPEPTVLRQHARALDETRRLGRMISDVRLLVQLEKADAARQAFSLGAVIQSALLRYADWAESLAVEIQYEANPSLPRVWGDRDQLTRVFENLIENALKYRSNGPDKRVLVAATHDADYVCIRFADNGIGIRAEDMTHIFEPGFRSPASVLATGSTGTGLGLTIVRRIVEQHGGRIEVASQPGVLTTFTIWLPRASKEEGLSAGKALL